MEGHKATWNYGMVPIISPRVMGFEIKVHQFFPNFFQIKVHQFSPNF
jgi:hypothetical protein